MGGISQSAAIGKVLPIALHKGEGRRREGVGSRKMKKEINRREVKLQKEAKE